MEISPDRFETSGNEDVSLMFSGNHMTSTPNDSYAIEGLSYIDKPTQLRVDATFKESSPMWIWLTWICNTITDLLYKIAQLAQVTHLRYKYKRKIRNRKIYKIVRYAFNKPAQIKFPKLSEDVLRVVAYIYAVDAGNYDVTSHWGLKVILIDDHGVVAPAPCRSYKSGCVSRSFLQAEVNAFRDVLDGAYAIQIHFGHELSHAVLIRLLTESRLLFYVIWKGIRTSEKRIIMNIYAVYRSYKLNDISNIGFVHTSNNLADRLAKSKTQAALQILSQLELNRFQVSNG